jgi:hypothetical protein
LMLGAHVARRPRSKVHYYRRKHRNAYMRQLMFERAEARAARQALDKRLKKTEARVHDALRGCAER